MGERRVVVRGRFRRRLFTGGAAFLLKGDGSLWVLQGEVPEMYEWTPSVVKGFAPGMWRTVEWELDDDTWADRFWSVAAALYGWFTRSGKDRA